MKKIFYLSLILSLACATSPTGRSQLLLIPDYEMTAMGARAFDQLKTKTPIEYDSKINAYVNCVAHLVAKEASEQAQVDNWEIKVFKDKSANAFALPGGKIGVHTGMVPVANTQHQLAAVLGHEVGHVIAKHSNERVSSQFTAQAGLLLLGSQARGSEEEKSRLLALLGIGAAVGVLLPHSRTQESEADIIGLELMAKAGFDPSQSVELWRNMAKAGGGKVPEFLSTHPSHDTRIRDLQSNMGPAMEMYRRAQAAGIKPNCSM